MSECTECEETRKMYEERLEVMERIHDYHEREMSKLARLFIAFSVIIGFIIGYVIGFAA